MTPTPFLKTIFWETTALAPERINDISPASTTSSVR